MKLNKTQISALADQVVEEIITVNSKFNADITEKEDALKDKFLEENPILKEYLSFGKPNNLKSYQTSSANNLKAYIEEKYPNIFEVLPKRKITSSYGLKDKVERELILATIDPETGIDTIIKKLVEKFTK